MATIIITDKEGQTVFTFSGKLMLADFLLNAAPGDYGFLIEQDGDHSRGSFTVIKRDEAHLNENLKGVLNYIQKRTSVHRSELTLVGRSLAQELVAKGYIKLSADFKYSAV